jgi:hypothetical protein
MPSEEKKPNDQRINAIISNNVKDHGNDPFVLKKAADSKAFLEKHGFPEEVISKKSTK